MKDTTVAARYAKALFIVTEKRGETAKALEDLKGLGQVLEPGTRVATFLANPETRLPDQIDAPMTPRQLATLRTLSAVAYQPKLFQRDLTAKEADRRIIALKAEIELADSF